MRYATAMPRFSLSSNDLVLLMYLNDSRVYEGSLIAGGRCCLTRDRKKETAMCGVWRGVRSFSSQKFEV